MMQTKKTFALVDYSICSPRRCDPDKGYCFSAAACSHKILKQIDGLFEPPMVFQDMCMGCWDCIEVCPLKAVRIREVL
jgi:ATP-binding cassette subfamily E protein 1